LETYKKEICIILNSTKNLHSKPFLFQVQGTQYDQQGSQAEQPPVLSAQRRLQPKSKLHQCKQGEGQHEGYIRIVERIVQEGTENSKLEW
jgi:hypothetical protein